MSGLRSPRSKSLVPHDSRWSIDWYCAASRLSTSNAHRFQHTFGPEVDFYQLQSGEEWNHVLRESAVAFYIHPTLEKANAFLFWR